MQITKLVPSIIFIEGDRDDPKTAVRQGIEGAHYGTDHVQQKHERVHADCTPVPDNPAYNETLVGVPGNPKQPWIEPRWGRIGPNGEEILNWNSTHEADHWSLESWEKKGPSDTSGPGLTPVFYMENQLGPGQTKCFVYYVLKAEHNDGLALDGSDREACPRAYWMAD